MTPTDERAADETPAVVPPPPPGIRLRKSLGSVGIILGTGLVVSMPFLDTLNTIRISGALSVQDLGVLIGFILLLSGLLLYLGSIISFMELRYHELAQRMEPRPAAAEKQPQSMVVLPAAPEVLPEKGAAAPAAEPPAVQELKKAEPEKEAPVPITAAAPEPEKEAPAPVTAAPPQPEKEAPIPAPPAVAATGQAPEPVQATEEAKQGAAVPAPAPPEAKASPAAEPPAYDYGTVPAPGAATCRVCGNELTGSSCRYCITSGMIQNAYQELSRTQELGASVEEAAVLLQSARQSLDEKDFNEAGEFARSAQHFLEISAKTYFALRAAVEKAELERKRMEASGMGTEELSSMLSNVRSAIVKGAYPEAKAFLDDERQGAAELRRSSAPRQPVRAYPERPRPPRTEAKAEPDAASIPPPEVMAPVSIVNRPVAPTPEVNPPEGPAEAAPSAPQPQPEKPPEAPAPVPKFESGISGCPKCGRKTMKGWKKCPHCLTLLQ